MATADETFDSTDSEHVGIEVEDRRLTTVEAVVDACGTFGQLKELDGEILDRTEADGRVRERYLRVISDSDDICWIEAGDKILHNYGEQTEILDIGPDLSDAAGMHVLEGFLEGFDSDESPVHLKLIQRWLREDNIIIVGVRTREFANRADLSD